MPFSLPALNAMNAADFTDALGDVFENSPWVATMARKQAPFTSVDALYDAMMNVVLASGPERQTGLLQAHPELSRVEDLSPASADEQGSMGLDRLSPEERARFATANTAYRSRFGFPFIIAVRGQRDRAAILAAVKSRLSNSPERERDAALAEVGKIARFRLDALVMEDPIGPLTTHVLDVGGGCPADGMLVELFELEGDRFRQLGSSKTGADGRLAEPLLRGNALPAGLYELLFHVAAWRDARKLSPGFYDTIPLRFRVTEPTSRIHVPLVLAPHGYSTYRGS